MRMLWKSEMKRFRFDAQATDKMLVDYYKAHDLKCEEIPEVHG